SARARWLPTWSVAGSWNADQEEFLKTVDWLSRLTVRGSYGLIASMGVATNSDVVLKNMNTNRAHTNEVESVIQLIDLENSDLTWEKQYSSDLGIDAGFFNNRVNMSLDLYKRNSFDLISIIKVPGIGGESQKAANYADMTNQGFDVLLGGDIFRTKDWGWKSNVTFTYSTTKITNAKNSPNIFSLVAAEGGAKEGYPVRGLFSLQYKGLQNFTGVPQFINEAGQ